MSNKIALIDLDGTLADYDNAMRIALAGMQSPEERSVEQANGPLAWDTPWLKARRDAIARVPGFWENLEPISAGFKVFNTIVKIGFTPMVVSKGPSHKSRAWAEKFNWVRKHLPGVQLTLTEDKTLSYGRVLFDDWPGYYEPWLAVRPRGLVVALARPENEAFTNYADRILRYRGDEDHSELLVRLTAAFDR